MGVCDQREHLQAGVRGIPRVDLRTPNLAIAVMLTLSTDEALGQWAYRELIQWARAKGSGIPESDTGTGFLCPDMDTGHNHCDPR